MSNGKYSTQSKLHIVIAVLLALLILLLTALAFGVGFLLGQRHCNAHNHEIAVPTELSEITAPSKLPETQAATEPVEKNNDLSIAYATLTGSANFWGKRLEVLMQPDGFTDKSGTDTVTNALYNFTMTLADGSTVDDLMLTFGELADTSTGALVTNPQSNGQSITDMDLHF